MRRLQLLEVSSKQDLPVSIYPALGWRVYAAAPWLPWSSICPFGALDVETTYYLYCTYCCLGLRGRYTAHFSINRLFVRLLVSYLIKLIAWKFVGVRMFYELEPRSECAKWLAPPLRSSTQPTSLVQMLTVR